MTTVANMNIVLNGIKSKTYTLMPTDTWPGANH